MEPTVTGFKIININIFFVPVGQIYLQHKKCKTFHQTMGEGLGTSSETSSSEVLMSLQESWCQWTQNQTELLVRTFLYTLSQPFCGGVIDSVWLALARQQFKLWLSVHSELWHICLTMIQVFFTHLVHGNLSLSLHCTLIMKFFSLSTCTSTVSLEPSLTATSSGRDENYMQNVIFCGGSLNPRMTAKSALNSAISESRIPWGTI